MIGPTVAVLLNGTAPTYSQAPTSADTRGDGNHVTLGRSLVGVTGANAVGQAILIAASPLLTRLYSPAQFGELTVFTVVATLLATLATLRVEVVLPYEPDPSVFGRLQMLGLAVPFLVGAMTTLVGLAIFLVGEPSGSLVAWALALPVAVVAGALLAVGTATAIRSGSVGVLGISSVARSGVAVAGQLGFAAVGAQAFGLPMGIAIGSLAGVAYLWVHLRRRNLVSPVSWRQLQGMRGESRRLAALTTAGLFNVLGTQGPILAFAALYARDDVGQLGLTQRVLALPAAVVGVAAGQGFAAALSERVRTGRPTRPIWNRMALTLLVIAAMPVLLLVVAGPGLFAVVFGPDWLQAGAFARWVGVAAAAQLISVPLSQAVVASGRYRHQLAWDIGRASASVSAVCVVGLSGLPAEYAVAGLAVTSTLAYVWQISLSRRSTTTPPGVLGASSP